MGKETSAIAAICSVNNPKRNTEHSTHTHDIHQMSLIRIFIFSTKSAVRVCAQISFRETFL